MHGLLGLAAARPGRIEPIISDGQKRFPYGSIQDGPFGSRPLTFDVRLSNTTLPASP